MSLNLCSWTPLWQSAPPPMTNVVVKVTLPDGSFQHDVATFYGKEAGTPWCLQFFKNGSVVAWTHLPV